MIRIISRIVRMSRAYSRSARHGNPFVWLCLCSIARREKPVSRACSEHTGAQTRFCYIQRFEYGRNNCAMPEEEPIERAREDEREGLSPSSQAGEFVREEMEHIREGEHGARSPQQAIAIGLSKARRAGVKLPPPKRAKAPARTRKQAKRDLAKGRRGARKKLSRTRARATKGALKRERRSAASRKALSRQARSAARRRSARSRSATAKKAARTRKRRKRR